MIIVIRLQKIIYLQILSIVAGLLYDAEKNEDLFKQGYKREVLIDVPHSPNQIAVDPLNYLYFSFDQGGLNTVAKKKLGTSKVTILQGVKDAFALSVDSVTGFVYFGGSHGIFKYNPFKKELKRLVIPNLDIWWLVIHKKEVYFIKFPNLSAYWYHNKTVKCMDELGDHRVNQFVFDLFDNIYFINSTGLYGLGKDDTMAVLLRDTPKFLGITSDRNGYIYVCSDEGIFVVSKLVQKVKKIINIQGVLGITFDNQNNLIYSDSREIVRLLPIYPQLRSYGPLRNSNCETATSPHCESSKIYWPLTHHNSKYFGYEVQLTTAYPRYVV